MAALKRFALVGACAMLGATANAQHVTLKGTVVDSATKQPVNGVVIELASDARRYATRSDEGGEFQVANVEPGTYRLVARRIGFAPTSRTVIVTNETRPIELRVAAVPQSLRAVRVRGEGMGIYGEIGQSSDLRIIPGATVEVAGTGQRVVTDSSGSYFVTVTRPGPYMVRVDATGFEEETFVVVVQRNRVADGSRLLVEGEGGHMPDGLWKDFDQRVRWRSEINSTLVSGSDVRRAGGGLNEAMQSIGSVVAHGLRLGPTVCVLVNGSPRPGLPLNAIRPEEIKAIEVYGPDREVGMFMQDTWPRGAPCSETGFHAPRFGTPKIGYVVIWTR